MSLWLYYTTFEYLSKCTQFYFFKRMYAFGITPLYAFSLTPHPHPECTLWMAPSENSHLFRICQLSKVANKNKPFKNSIILVNDEHLV